MKRKREYIDFVKDILEYSQKIERFVANISFEDFVRNEEKVLAVIHSLQIIGEAAKHIPKSIRDKYQQVPWSDIVGMRNFIVHGYFIVDVEIIWKTLREDLPLLKKAMIEVLEDINE